MKSKTGAISGSTNWALVQQKFKKKKKKKNVSSVKREKSECFSILLNYFADNKKLRIKFRAPFRSSIKADSWCEYNLN